VAVVIHDHHGVDRVGVQHEFVRSLLGLAHRAHRDVSRLHRLIRRHGGELELPAEYRRARPHGDRVLVHRCLDGPHQGLAARRLQPVPEHLQPEAGGRPHARHRVGVAGCHADGVRQHRLGRGLGAPHAHRHRVLAGRHPLVPGHGAVADVPEHDPGRGIAEGVEVDVHRRGVGRQVGEPQPSGCLGRAGGGNGEPERAGWPARARRRAWPASRRVPIVSLFSHFRPGFTGSGQPVCARQQRIAVSASAPVSRARRLAGAGAFSSSATGADDGTARAALPCNMSPGPSRAAGCGNPRGKDSTQSTRLSVKSLIVSRS
jgi:hypothetical protein